MHWSTARSPYWKKMTLRHDAVNTKVNSTVKQMSNGSINADTRQDLDSKYPLIRSKKKIELLLHFRPPFIIMNVTG